jgi:HSP20 family protein
VFGLRPWSKKENWQENRELAQQSERHPLTQLRSELDDLFGRFWKSWPVPLTEFPRGLEVQERDGEVLVRAELPGFEPNELDVEISGQTLTIKAEHRQEGDRKREYRSFSQTVVLPPGIDRDGIEATCRNGVLQLRVPRSEEACGKRIAVNG